MDVAANVWLERRVLGYAHQGGALEAPSSTLYAIERAVALGVDGIELDVHQTKDQVLVVGHDATLEGTTNGSGPIAEHTLAEIKALDAGYLFVPGHTALRGWPESDYAHRGKGPADPGFVVATLEEAIEAAGDAVVNLDIKSGPPAVPAYEAELARVIRRHGREDSVIVTSFDDHRTARFSALAPEIGTSPGVSGLTSFVQAVRAGERPVHPGGSHVALQLPDEVAGTPLIDTAIVEACHGLGLACHVWTVDDSEEMWRLVGLGVDAIMSDRPSLLVEVLSRAERPGGKTTV